MGVVTKKCMDFMKKDAEEKAKTAAKSVVHDPAVALKAHK